MMEKESEGISLAQELRLKQWGHLTFKTDVTLHVLLKCTESPAFLF